MAELRYGDDPEPLDRFPAGPLYIPVRPGRSGCAARLFRTPLGVRTAVGFTSERRLAATLGPGQAWIRLAGTALRALTEPLGVTTVTVDPQFTAPAPTPSAPAASAAPSAPSAAAASAAAAAVPPTVRTPLTPLTPVIQDTPANTPLTPAAPVPSEAAALRIA
ncbi:SAV_915 family protein [Streptomyces sp. NPDC029080]|uniref:SAV_915 family protein n=1 Tax=unclassified Streptomyces TaxID=2593676 RepID=UPI001F3B537B|nr:SAV_915 family protein [Streptomyces sp. SID486]